MCWLVSPSSPVAVSRTCTRARRHARRSWITPQPLSPHMPLLPSSPSRFEPFAALRFSSTVPPYLKFCTTHSPCTHLFALLPPSPSPLAFTCPVLCRASEPSPLLTSTTADSPVGRDAPHLRHCSCPLTRPLCAFLQRRPVLAGVPCQPLGLLSQGQDGVWSKEVRACLSSLPPPPSALLPSLPIATSERSTDAGCLPELFFVGLPCARAPLTPSPPWSRFLGGLGLVASVDRGRVRGGSGHLPALRPPQDHPVARGQDVRTHVPGLCHS